jgi:starch synthase
VRSETEPRLRLVGAARGDPRDPRTASGVARYLFAALGRRYEMQGGVDVLTRGWQRALVAMTTFHPSRAVWRERYDKNLLAFRLQSWNCKRALRRLPGPVDAVMQVYGLFQTRGKPYVIYTDNTHSLTCEHWPRWNTFRGRALRRWLENERRLYAEASHVFTMGTPAAESLIDYYGLAADRVSVVGGGANFDRLPAVPERLRRRPVVLFVGRDFHRKGGDVLVTAFRMVRARMPDATLVVVGTEDAPREDGVDVRGTVGGRDELAKLYEEATVFCLPSRFEPYGLALLEAMAYGLPCVATRRDAFPEIIEDARTGRLVVTDDADGLAAALLDVLRNPERAAALGVAGRRRIETHLNWDAVVERMAPGLEAAL